jgi:ERCC4-type nuclease
MTSDAPLTVPFTVVIDRRERLPFAFANLKADARRRRRPLVVPTVAAHLPSGDYSIEGFQDKVAVERKSLEDLYGTLGQHRDRFERELARLDEMDFAAVVVEADWPAILFTPPVESSLLPKTVFRSVLAWQQRFPRVHWWTAYSRDFAEIITFRVLERFWNDLGRRPETSE